MKKKKPNKLEAKVAELEKRLALFEKIQVVGKAEPSIKEPETFEDCVEVFSYAYYTDPLGEISVYNPDGHIVSRKDVVDMLKQGTGLTSEKRAKQLAAIAKMMTVADALNGEHLTDGVGLDAWENGVRITDSYQMVSFKTEALAKKAIKILGEETIKTAFGL